MSRSKFGDLCEEQYNSSRDQERGRVIWEKLLIIDKHTTNILLNGEANQLTLKDSKIARIRLSRINDIIVFKLGEQRR